MIAQLKRKPSEDVSVAPEHSHQCRGALWRALRWFYQQSLEPWNVERILFCAFISFGVIPLKEPVFPQIVVIAIEYS